MNGIVILNDINMIERFKLLLGQLKVSPSEFADRIGVQRSNISHILSGRSKPGLDFLEKMLNAYPDVDVVWLITGKPFDSNRKLSPPITKSDNTLTETPYNDDAVNFEGKKRPPQSDEEAVEKIIFVYTNNTFRIVKNRKS